MVMAGTPAFQSVEVAAVRAESARGGKDHSIEPEETP